MLVLSTVTLTYDVTSNSSLGGSCTAASICGSLGGYFVVAIALTAGIFVISIVLLYLIYREGTGVHRVQVP
jgi:hypothetical protein